MTTGYSIELLFDDEFSAYVTGLWQSCKKNNFSHYMQSIKGDVTPHIALSLYEGVHEEKITSLFKRYKNVKERSASFESTAVCMFKDTFVTYINVNVNRNMLNYFENIYNFFAEISDNCSPYYVPSMIIPHISISKCTSLQESKTCWNHIADVFERKTLTVKKIALFRLIFDDEHKLTECNFLDEKILTN